MLPPFERGRALYFGRLSAAVGRCNKLEIERGPVPTQSPCDFIRCSKCRQELSPDNFNIDRTCITLRRRVCKKCERQKKKSPEYKKQSSKYWRLANGKKRIAKHYSLSLGQIKQLYAAISEAQYLQCHWCDNIIKAENCHVDHVIPLKLCGPHDIWNMAISCIDCNLIKGDAGPEKTAQMFGKDKVEPYLTY